MELITCRTKEIRGKTSASTGASTRGTASNTASSPNLWPRLLKLTATILVSLGLQQLDPLVQDPPCPQSPWIARNQQDPLVPLVPADQQPPNLWKIWLLLPLKPVKKLLQLSQLWLLLTKPSELPVQRLTSLPILTWTSLVLLPLLLAGV